jgi:hypothetical protein
LQEFVEAPLHHLKPVLARREWPGGTFCVPDILMAVCCALSIGSTGGGTSCLLWLCRARRGPPVLRESKRRPDRAFCDRATTRRHRVACCLIWINGLDQRTPHRLRIISLGTLVRKRRAVEPSERPCSKKAGKPRSPKGWSRDEATFSGRSSVIGIIDSSSRPRRRRDQPAPGNSDDWSAHFEPHPCRHNGALQPFDHTSGSKLSDLAGIRNRRYRCGQTPGLDRKA